MSCLNFIILKVNGIDVSSFPHEEAVQLFLKAQEPIIVEVRRKTPNDVNKLSFFDEPPSSKQLQSITDNKILSSIACQTDISGTTGCGVTIDQQTLEGDDISSPQHCCHSDSQNILNECLAPEIDIEEITLHKSRSDEKLGFTVSYSSGNGSASDTGSDDDDNDDDDDEDDEDTCADIYISDILPDSLAARDGRLRQGDQILQINGRDVSNKDETESLFAENKNPITLLVSRCLYTDDEFLDSAVYCDDKEHNPGQSSCDCEQNTFSSKSSNSENSKNKLQPIVPIDTAVCDHLSHDKIKAQLESVNKEISLLNSQISNMKLQKGTTICSKSSPSTIIKNKKIESLHGTQGGGINKKSDQRDPPKIPFIPPPFETDNVEHIYETIPEDSETDSYYCSPYESKDQSRVEQWLKSQGCTTTTTTATTTATINTSSGTGGGALVRFGISQTAPKNMKDLYLNHITWNRICKNNSSGDDYENSSSAYNTGGSCNSNPLTFELKTDDKNQSSSTLVFRPYSRQLESVENCKQCQKYRKEKLSPKNKKLLAKTTEVLSATTTTTTTTTTITSSTARGHQIGHSLLPSSGANTMYTNVENLHQTIKLQRKLFRKALLRKNSAPQSQVRATIASSTTGSSTAGAFVAPSLSQYQFVGSQQEQKSEQMVWKVKRRPDGSRYIVRRPVKNQLLQDRARRINEERNSMTTEDETVSEVKVGRYWTKDERKRHVERSKERRQRQEMLIAAKKNQTTQQWLV